MSGPTNIPPCRETKESPDHDWEVMLRCTRCGFLIRCENTPHSIDRVREFLYRALQRVKLWLS